MAASFCRRSFLNYKNCLFQTPKRTGYVVLIPETPEEVSECNVVSLENLPNFSKLDAHICRQILFKYAQQYDIGTWELDERLQKDLKESEKLDVFKNYLEPFEVLAVPFLSSWGVSRTLFLADKSIMPLSAFHSMSERFMQCRSEKYNKEAVFKACKKHLDTKDHSCTEEQRRILNKFIWEGTHSGLGLDQNKKEEFTKHLHSIQLRTVAYENKYMGSLSLFKQIIKDKDFVKDTPLDLLRSTSIYKNKPLEGPWIVTLNEHVYNRYLEYCTSREARRHIWFSFNQLCSPKLGTAYNTYQEIEGILRSRFLFAQTLGFPSYAHLSMQFKMAKTLENVQATLFEILELAKYNQERELYELEKFAYENDREFSGSLELWDLPYWKRMERVHKFGIDELSLNEYFPLGQVILGLFALCEQLFGIEIEEQTNVDTWNPDVRYFRVTDEKTKTILGGFYFDPYSRPEKSEEQSGKGWFIPIRPRSKVCASLPISALVFSFTPPSEEKPSLLYLGEIENLFEKFGQMLQYTLTQMNFSEVSGTSNIEWDAVEICNKFLRFWLCERGTLESISGHYNTGEPLPSQTLDNLCNLHKHMAGTELCKDIYLSNLDLELHLQVDDCMTVARKLWPEHLLFSLVPFDYHPFGLKDIFINPWGGALYSRVWSKMVAADAFLAFVEADITNQEQVKELGRKFRSTFLSLGGGCEPGEIFRRFRGRDPTPESLMTLLDLRKTRVIAPSSTPVLALS